MSSRLQHLKAFWRMVTASLEAISNSPTLKPWPVSVSADCPFSPIRVVLLPCSQVFWHWPVRWHVRLQISGAMTTLKRSRVEGCSAQRANLWTASQMTSRWEMISEGILASFTFVPRENRAFTESQGSRTLPDPGVEKAQTTTEQHVGARLTCYSNAASEIMTEKKWLKLPITEKREDREMVSFPTTFNNKQLFTSLRCLKVTCQERDTFWKFYKISLSNKRPSEKNILRWEALP